MNLQLPITPETCQCPYCIRSRRFVEIVNKQLEGEDKEWMIGFLDYVVNLEETHDMLEMYVDDIRKHLDTLKEK